MRYKFIVVYGLPGSGKTTLCEKAAEVIPNLHYIRLDKDPNFGKVPTIDIIKKEFRTDTHIITEGCFEKMNFRKHLLKEFSKTHFGICVYNNENLQQLPLRRNRSIEEYKELLKDTQILSRKPHHLIMSKKSIDERVEFINEIIQNNYSIYNL